MYVQIGKSSKSKDPMMRLLTYALFATMLCTTASLTCMQKSKSETDLDTFYNKLEAQKEQASISAKKRCCCVRTGKRKIATGLVVAGVLTMTGKLAVDQAGPVVDAIYTGVRYIKAVEKDLAVVRKSVETIADYLKNRTHTNNTHRQPTMKEVAKQLNITHDPITGEPV